MTQKIDMPAVSAFQAHHRPQYHYTARENWINDPNGLIYVQGEYHLFYQHNPQGTHWGNMSWGHAVSRDLLHWEELPVALADDGEVMIFSGCAVLDETNSSGFGTTHRPPLVIMYTGHRRSDGNQAQYLAYSTDSGRTWTKHGPPVLDEGRTAFRDPKILWHEPSRCWVLVLVRSDDHQAVFYHSPDLLHWTWQSSFGPTGHTDGIWEMPELFELATEQGSTHWVLKVDLHPGGPQGGSGSQYFVGHFDGRTFQPQQAAKWVEYGKDFYAAMTFADVPGRVIWLGWMNNWQYAHDLDHHAWNGHLSIPRTLSLKSGSTGLQLVQTPAFELTEARGPLHVLPNANLLSGQELLCYRQAHPALELNLELQALPDSAFGLKFSYGGFEELRLEYQSVEQTFSLTRSNGIRLEGFDGTQAAPLTLDRGALHLHIFLDWSSIEVFTDGGRLVLSDALFPSRKLVEITLYVLAGHVQLKRGQAWELRATATTV